MIINLKRIIFVLSVIIVITVVALIYYLITNEKPESVVVEPPPPKILFGINIDSLKVFEGSVRKDQNLSDILSGYGVDFVTIDALAKHTRHIFDVRKIRYGNKYFVFAENNTSQKAQYFIYEISPIDYVVFNLGEDLKALRRQKEVKVSVDTAVGVINSSLWNAMIDNHCDPNLANELSEIYAWTIDFFGIQKGDNYKVIYESQWVDGKRIGIGKILAANFNHYKNDYYAFLFVQDFKGDYFDEKANSLRRAFLKAPLKFKRISSHFSYSRMHPVLKYRRPHLGVDYAADVGTPVVSIGDGTVISADWSGGGGRAVKIRHNGTYSTTYMHLSKYGEGIRAGVRIRQGQVIGYVGSSGLSTGPHLDFRVYKNGQPIDPLKMESPPAEPVKTENLQKFILEKDKWMRLLQRIRIPGTESV